MIKMKVKNIILTVIGILIILFMIIPFLNIQIADSLKDSKPDISEKLYKINLKYPSKFMKDKSLYNLSEEIMDEFGRYYIFGGARLGGALLEYEDVEEVIENYEKVIKDYPRSTYYEMSYRRIMDCYIYLGDSENLDKWIGWGSRKNDPTIMKISELYRSFKYFANREYDIAEKILEDYSLGDEKLDYIYYFLKGHIEFMKENFDRASEYYSNAVNLGWEYETSLFGNYPPYNTELSLEAFKRNKGDNRIRGRVTVNGDGIPFVEIYLKNPIVGYSSRDQNFIAITDEDGYFETIGVQDKGYEIGIGIATPIIFDHVYMEKGVQRLDVKGDMEFNFEFVEPMKIISPGLDESPIDGKFTAEWEEVKGTDYYTIHSIGYKDLESNFGTNIRFPIYDENGEEKIKDTKAIFDIEDLNHQGAGIMYTGEEGEGEEKSTITPQGILGYFGPGSNMTIFVNAYDKEGKLLNSNLPVISYSDDLPSIKVPAEEFSEGEELIIDRKYEKAIDYYEDILSRDENNIEALKYLYRIYYYNYYEDEEKQEKGIEYGIRFYEIVGKDKFLRMLDDIKVR